MNRVENQSNAMIVACDDEAEACGWFGPKMAFGLAYKYVQHGQSILDIGIGRAACPFVACAAFHHATCLQLTPGITRPVAAFIPQSQDAPLLRR